jgi:hypothetical protein
LLFRAWNLPLGTRSLPLEVQNFRIRQIYPEIFLGSNFSQSAVDFAWEQRL